MGEPLLTIEQVAELLCVPVTTVYQWNYRGIGDKPGIPRIQVGRHVRYRPEDVEAWITANVVTDGAPPEAGTDG